MSAISYYGIKTIFIFEIQIYFKEFQFNVIAPLINTLLFVLILSTLENYYMSNNESYSYIKFLVPGIIMMVVIQTSFNHLSEVIISMKQTGSFNDFLISPISRVEIFISFILSSIFVCISVCMINLIALSFFVEFQNIDYLNFFYYLIITIIIFSSIGAITGFLSYRWDSQSSISNFIIMPISFMSGTFFSIESLSDKWKFFYEFNPFYHLVSGFRNSLIQNNKLNFVNEIYILIVLFIFFTIAIIVFKKGYKVIN